VVYAGFWRRFAAAFIDGIILSIPIGIIVGIVIAMNSQALLSLVNVLSLIIQIAYFAVMESSEAQATIGKRVMGIIVTDSQGGRISTMRALGRAAGKIVSGAICCIGYIMAAFTQRKQALHDMIADTVVVARPPTGY
jgi:uncharacterized RDD family membrane protein YckC